MAYFGVGYHGDKMYLVEVVSNGPVDKAQKILDFIRAFQQIKGYPPTLVEIVRGTGVSRTMIHSYYLPRLKRAGKLSFSYGKARGIRVYDNT